MSIACDITVSGQAFVAAVTWAARWVPTRPAAPIHACFLLEVAEGALTVSAMGENASARAAVLLDGVETPPASQRAVVSARLLAELAGTFKAAPVTVGGTEESMELAVGRWHGSLPTMPEGDYPALPRPLPALGTVNGDALADAVARVGAAVGRDTEKPPMFSGVYLGFGDEVVTIMATDRYRVARVTLPWTNRAADAPELTSVVALGVALVDAGGSFAGPDDITIGSDGALLSLASSSRSVTMRLLDSAKYDAGLMHTWLDAPTAASATFRTSDMTEPLKRARIVREKGGPIRLSLTPGLITLTAKADEINQAGDEEIDAAYDGDQVSIGFNPLYLAAALSSAPGSEVVMQFPATTKFATFCVEGVPTWKHLVVSNTRA